MIRKMWKIAFSLIKVMAINFESKPILIKVVFSTKRVYLT